MIIETKQHHFTPSNEKNTLIHSILTNNKEMLAAIVMDTQFYLGKKS